VFPVTFPCAPDLPDPLPDPTPINQVEGDPRSRSIYIVTPVIQLNTINIRAISNCIGSHTLLFIGTLNTTKLR